MLSEQPHLYAPFQKLIDTMKYKPETPEQAAKRTEAQTERTRKNAASWLDSSVLASLKRYGNEEQMETYAVLREAFLSGEPGSVEQISAFKKNVTGRVIPKSERERLEIFERMLSGMQAQEAPQIGRTETDFYRNSVRMGKNVKRRRLLGQQCGNDSQSLCLLYQGQTALHIGLSGRPCRLCPYPGFR